MNATNDTMPDALRQLLVDAAAALENLTDFPYVTEENDDAREAVRLAGRLRDAAAGCDASPEMLAVLKSLRRALGRLEDWRSIDATEIDSIIASDGLRVIDAVLDKVEPRAVRHRVNVTVEVTLDTTPGEASEPGNVIMAAVEAVRDGEGVVVAHEIVK